MNINKDNYEVYLLDLMEGRLNAEESQQVRDFLLLNPDCEEGLTGVQAWNLVSETIVFKGKEGLKKEFPNPSTPLTPSNFDLFSIARLEGDLTMEQEADHDRLMEEDEARKKEWAAWQQTRLPGESTLYGRKDQLIKVPERRGRVIWISVISAAAAVALIIILIRINPALTDPAGAGQMIAVEKVDDPVGPQVPSVDPLALASEPVTLSIQKHQDPPELTGEDQDPVQTGVQSDTSSRVIDEEKIEARPLKLSMMNLFPKTIAETGKYDRIAPLDLPPVYSPSERLTWTQLAEKSLWQAYKDYVKEKDLSLLTIASAGVEGINRLTGSDLSLNLSRNEGGEISGFRFRSNLLSVDSPVDKTE